MDLSPTCKPCSRQRSVHRVQATTLHAYGPLLHTVHIPAGRLLRSCCRIWSVPQMNGAMWTPAPDVPSRSRERGHDSGCHASSPCSLPPGQASPNSDLLHRSPWPRHSSCSQSPTQSFWQPLDDRPADTTQELLDWVFESPMVPCSPAASKEPSPCHLPDWSCLPDSLCRAPVAPVPTRQELVDWTGCQPQSARSAVSGMHEGAQDVVLPQASTLNRKP